MKNFTKAALIIALVLVILGSAFCAVGMGIGFSFPEFWEEVELGEYSIGPLVGFPFFHRESTSTVSMEKEAETDYAAEVADAEMQFPEPEAMEGLGDMASETNHFPWESIKNIEVEAYYGTVVIAESARENQEEIFVCAEYAKDDGKHKIRMYMDGDTLHVEETEKKASRILRKEDTYISIEIPPQAMDTLSLKKVDLKQENGSIYIDAPLTAEEIEVKVEKGECVTSARMAATEKMKIEVDAGNGHFDALEAKSLKAEVGMGEISVNQAEAEEISMECGMGTLELHVVGKESDYSYDLECGVGTIEVGDSSYSGLAGEKEIKNPGSKKMNVECGMGTIYVHFSET